MQVVELESTERVVRVRFNGIVYRRYPLSRKSSERNYFRAGRGDAIKGRSSLHRDLWKYRHGDIPDGFEIDHRDGNPLNNSMENLQLLTSEQHAEKHREESRSRTRNRLLALSPEQLAESVARMRPWHSTEEGREWHREHGREIVRNMPEIELSCDQCGKIYRTKTIRLSVSRFCHINCKMAARRVAGKDHEERVCRCGKTFTCNKYFQTKSCSRSCGVRQGHERRRAGV